MSAGMLQDFRRRKGFTLVELSISAVIVMLIGLVLVAVFRSNLATWKWGQEHMEFNQKLQLAMKQVFTDIKRINPVVQTDTLGNLWFQGERIGDLYPNVIEIVDTDKDPANGGEELTFCHTSYTRPGESLQVRLFLEKDALMRETTDQNGAHARVVVSDRVSDLHFTRNTADINEIAVTMRIADDRNPKLVEVLAFAVYLDTDLVCVKSRDAS
ncbi:MAG TPA: prepilin-type N-terminal cleavage/methylation domain-containing protein [Candidatus Ozemobacteraceae bacterium]|nr:prepilin-type N-terminal cleavage/methylation domain-containing protein [Candidatus Ozemobacteraceae bacterium]